MPGLNTLARKSWDATRTFGDVVHFLHVYTLEAHPQSPYVSPYSGTVWEAEYSTLPQALTYADRVTFARLTRGLIEGRQIQVVDALDREGLVNPVWCTYGPSPNATYLIGRDGTIAYAHRWTDAEEIEAAIRALLAR